MQRLRQIGRAAWVALPLLGGAASGLAEEKPLRMEYQPESLPDGSDGWTARAIINAELNNYLQLKEVLQNLKEYLGASLKFDNADMYRDGVKRRDNLARYVMAYARAYDMAQKLKSWGFSAKQSELKPVKGQQYFLFIACKNDTCTPISAKEALFMSPVKFNKVVIVPCCECPPGANECAISGKVPAGALGGLVDTTEATPPITSPAVLSQDPRELIRGALQ
ncbi:hypothetical protein LMIY3S_04845 [Labrys miyagiensis]